MSTIGRVVATSEMLGRDLLRRRLALLLLVLLPVAFYLSTRYSEGGSGRRETSTAPLGIRGYSPSWRAMTMRWTSFVPSPISLILQSRQ